VIHLLTCGPQLNIGRLNLANITSCLWRHAHVYLFISCIALYREDTKYSMHARYWTCHLVLAPIFTGIPHMSIKSSIIKNHQTKMVHEDKKRNASMYMRKMNRTTNNTYRMSHISIRKAPSKKFNLSVYQYTPSVP
jgi:hypothetical protein